MIQRQSEPIGSILFGDRLYNSPFQVSVSLDWGKWTDSVTLVEQINMLSNVTCKVLGTTEIISDSADFIGDRIHEMYALNFLVVSYHFAFYSPCRMLIDSERYRMGYRLQNGSRSARNRQRIPRRQNSIITIASSSSIIPTTADSRIE